MARYIDADALTEQLKVLEIFITGMLCGKTQLTEAVAEYKKSALRLIDEQPTADVVPRDICMLWKELAEESRSDVAREIFEEIDVTWSENYSAGAFFEDVAELKKKYTEK